MIKVMAWVSLFVGFAANTFAALWSGSGSAADPYQIATEADLVALQTQVAAGAYIASNFLQTADITITAWSGVGTSETVSFQGVYDGDNKTITVQFDSGKYRGVFGYIKNATVKNLNVHVTGHTAINSADTGGAAFVGKAYSSTLQNLTATCDAGGMGSAEAPLSHNVAGIAVWAGSSTFTGCTNKMDLATSYTKMAGILAFCDVGNVTFNYCSNEGDIVSLHDHYDQCDSAAGILGWTGQTTGQSHVFNHCRNTGTITCEQEGGANCVAVGNIIGYNHLEGSAVTLTGDIVGLDDYRGCGNSDNFGIFAWAFADTPSAGLVTFTNSPTINATYKLMQSSGATKSFVLAEVDDYITIFTNMYAYTGTVSLDAAIAETAELQITGDATSVTYTAVEVPTYTVYIAAGAGVANLQYKLGAAEEWTAYTEALANIVEGTVLQVTGTTASAGYEVTNVTVTVVADYPSGSPLTINKSLIRYFPTAGTLAAYPDQDGSAANPFVLATADDYVALKNAVTNGTAGTYYYKQVADITLGSEGTPWAGIGLNASQPGGKNLGFSGKLDGGNYTLNVYMARGRYHGVFNWADGATISNMTVNVTGWATAAGATDYDGGGALLGRCKNSTVRNVTSTGNPGELDDIVGGIAGAVTSSTFISCTNKINLTASRWHIGGIVGYCDTATCVFSKCCNEGNLENNRPINFAGASPVSIAGIVGWANGAATIDSCVNTGTLTTGAYWGDPTSTKFGFGSIIGTYDQVVTTITGNNVGRDNVDGCLHSVAGIQWAIPDTPSAGLVTFCAPVTSVAGTVTYKTMKPMGTAFTLTDAGASLTVVTNFAAYTGTVSLDASLTGDYVLEVSGDGNQVVYTVAAALTPVEPGGSSEPMTQAEAEAAAADPDIVAVPAAVAAAVADQATYKSMFMGVAVQIGDDWYVDVVMTEATSNDVQTAVNQAASDIPLADAAAGDTSVSVTAKKGLYYSVLSGSDLNDMTEGDRVMATDANVADGKITLTIPNKGTSGFYRILVNMRDKE